MTNLMGQSLLWHQSATGPKIPDDGQSKHDPGQKMNVGHVRTMGTLRVPQAQATPALP